MTHVTVDTSAERFGAATTIAHLAANSFPEWDHATRTIYDADAVLDRDWKWERESTEMEYATGLSETFKDGSKLHIAAHGDCCEGQGSGCRHCGQ